MSLSTTVLPNFLKTVLFAAATSMSFSALANGLDHGQSTVGDLKDLSSEGELQLESTQDELKALLADEEATAEELEAASTELESSDLVNEAKDLAIPEAE